jgi:hypothetical protein
LNKAPKKIPTTSFALSYGISILVVALAAFLGLLIWLYQVVSGTTPFSWATLSVYVIAFAFTLPIGLALIKVSITKKKDETPH